MKVAIIGAGAAGCFLAQRLKELRKDVSVELYEAHQRPLMKVAVTGGGRCNLTNSFALVNDLKEVYPRGHRLMKRLMYDWNQWDTMSWFEEHGVPLLTQDDECVFPVSQDAMDIVNTLKKGLTIHTNYKVADIEAIDADVVVVTTGGARNFEWLEKSGVEIIAPVPSLFPLKLKPSGLEELMGIVLEDVGLTIAGTKLKSYGTMLITHFGVSGPAVLRLSSYGARHLADNDYKGKLIVNWLGDYSHDEAMEWLEDIARTNADRQINKITLKAGGARWQNHILKRSGIALDTLWKALNSKRINRLVNALTSDTYDILGRAPHKEEFVTCGGVSLASVDSTSLESKTRKNLFFAGEVLDIDGVTGGFNLQAAFTTANAIARCISRCVG